MASTRTREPWMAPDKFARTLPRGIGLTLLVGDVDAEVAFCREVLGAMILHADADFAAIELCGSVFMLYAEHASRNDSPSPGDAGTKRGAGVEIRVMGLDPDKAEARARERAATIVSASTDTAHGLRECRLGDPGGFVWVPATPST